MKLIKTQAGARLEIPPHNNFGIMRLALATLVVFGHFKTLAGISRPYGIYSYADFAVDAFFVVSGYLIAASFDAKPKLLGFYIRRMFRLYPLYIIVILAQAVCMLLLLPGGIAEHINGFLHYIIPNSIFATFLAYDIDGLLSHLHNPGINPSLWTLKIEVGFYLILPFLWMLTRRFGFSFLLILFVLSTVFYETAIFYGRENLAKQLPAQLRFFVVGMAYYRYGYLVNIRKHHAAVAAALLFALCNFREEFPFVTHLYPLLIGTWVFLCAVKIPALPLTFDISYGVYLFHGPLIQFSILSGLFEDTHGFLLMLLVCVFTLAFIAEFLIERPGIALGKRLARKADNRNTTYIGQAA